MATFTAPPIDMSIFDCRQTRVDSEQHSRLADTDMTSSKTSFADHAVIGGIHGQGNDRGPCMHGSNGHGNTEHGHHGHQHNHGHTFLEHAWQHGNGQLRGHGHQLPEHGQHGNGRQEHGHQLPDHGQHGNGRQEHGHQLPEHGQHGNGRQEHGHENSEHGRQGNVQLEHEHVDGIGHRNEFGHEHKLTNRSPPKIHRSLASTQVQIVYYYYYH